MSLILRNIELTDIPQLNRFKCGNPSMDNFLVKEAFLNHVTGEGITKVLVEEETEEIIAYFTLKADSIK